MTQEPKLLTEAEARQLLCCEYVEDQMRLLRERGLIAPDPDKPSQAAVEAAEKLWEEAGPWSLGTIQKVTARFANFEAAIRHDMELARPELTREQVREAYYDAGGLEVGSFIDRLHAALAEQVRP